MDRALNTKGDPNHPMPCRLRGIAKAEGRVRDWVGNRFPGGPPGLLLKQLADLLRLAELRLFLDGIALGQPDKKEDLVLLAISEEASPKSKKGVVGLPLALAFKVVDLALDRRSIQPDRELSGGEQGVLLYAVDKLGADWLGLSGAPFVVRGFLKDADQMEDYLGQRPKWQVTGGIRGEVLESRIWVWFTDPISPRRSLPFVKELPQLAANWPVDVRISIGWSELLLVDLNALRANDVVVLDEGSHPDHSALDACVTIHSGAWKRYGRWLDRRRIQLVSRTGSEAIMDTKVDKTKEVDVRLKPWSDPDQGSMEVVVQVEVGAVKMTVAEAGNLVPGRIVKLNRDVTGAVVLKVGDKAIAKGELVDQEGELAVEVLEVL